MPNEESPFVRLDDNAIIPASITSVPNLYHSASGSVSVLSASASEVSASASFDLATSWRILGLLEVDLSTSWGVGEGEFYWYRVEGECGQVTCEDFRVGYDGCSRMTFVSTIAARSLPELCNILSRPATSSPVGTRISSIRRYSRPTFRGQTPDEQCNVLNDLEFCHIPECADYCAEESPAPLIGLHNIVLPFGEGPVESESLVSSGTESHISASVLEEPSSFNEMEGFVGTVSACGCTAAPTLIPIRHSLKKSGVFSRFVKSRMLDFPPRLDLVHRPSESSWESATHLSYEGGEWIVQVGMACLEGNLWRLSLSVRESRRQTRLIVDVPSEIMCIGGRPSALVQVYFDKGVTAFDGPVYPVRTPERKERFSATSSVEVYVGGIFVPQVVYYDGMGLFQDSFWDYSPFELDINPTSKNPTTLFTLDGIA